MRVDSNSHVPDPLKVAPLKSRTPEVLPEKHAADFTASAQLTEALEKIPMVRADKIEMAKALVANPDYPNEATLRKVANILVDNIRPEMED
jgi:hypothetical protein